MKRAIFFVMALVGLPLTSHAQGFNLSWNDCGLAGQSLATFACNTNSGSQTLVVSYEPIATMTNMIGVDVRIDIISESSPLPDWWMIFAAGSCRQGAFTASADAPGTLSCSDVWASPVGGIGTFYNYSNRGAVGIFFAMLQPVRVDPGTEYYDCSLTIANTQTIGLGACAGCASTACLILSVVQLDGDNNTLQKIEMPRDRDTVFWQSGFLNCTTPNLRRTWGQIKSLYR